MFDVQHMRIRTWFAEREGVEFTELLCEGNVLVLV